jgi:hypothetical protein
MATCSFIWKLYDITGKDKEHDNFLFSMKHRPCNICLSHHPSRWYAWVTHATAFYFILFFAFG